MNLVIKSMDKKDHFTLVGLDSIPAPLAQYVIDFSLHHKAALLSELGSRSEAEFYDVAFDAGNRRTIPADDYQSLVDAFNKHLPRKVIYLHIYKEQRRRAG